MYDKTDMRYRYQTDPQFESFIHRAEFTPSEIREAAMLASINYELTHIRKVYVVSPSLESALDYFHNEVDKELRKQSDD